MKISKLFHWLYAFLMFLPVTFLLPSLLYFGFNDNATAQEYTKEEPNYYQSNDVSSQGDLIVGRVYTWQGGYEGAVVPSYNEFFSCYALSGFQYTGSDYLYKVYQNANTNQIWVKYTVSGNERYTQVTNSKFDFYLVGLELNIPNNVISCISECENSYQDGTYTEITYTMGITESINQSILDTFDLPMFSWTSDNFIIAPFNYITNLFGLPEGNVVNKYLDYWLSISIIYLCFDVIMYVPLLVHRWLDKGIVE